MKLHLTKKEYRALLDLIMTGNWVLHSHSVDQEEFSQVHQEIIQKILSYSKEMGCDNLFVYDQQFQQYVETKEYENFVLNNFIEPYDEQNFWSELADRLARRDVEEEIGRENLFRMDPLERMKLLSKKSTAYENELEEHGLLYLAITKQNLISN